jgi:hypothetical protein
MNRRDLAQIRNAILQAVFVSGEKEQIRDSILLRMSTPVLAQLRKRLQRANDKPT